MISLQCTDVISSAWLSFVAWLGQYLILEVLGAVSTIALVVFAGVQVWLALSARRQRVRSALFVFRSEVWRIWTVSRRWELENIEFLSRAGLFDPDEIRPIELGVIRSALAEIGPFASQLAALAFSRAEDAARHAKSIEFFWLEEEKARSAEDVEDIAKAQAARARAVKAARDASSLAAQALEDVARGAPKWTRTVRFDDSQIQSEIGLKLLDQLRSQGQLRVGAVARLRRSLSGRWSKLWIARRP